MKWVLLTVSVEIKSPLRPMLGSNCRFAPSCSDYAREAVEKHGMLLETWLAVKRIADVPRIIPAATIPFPDVFDARADLHSLEFPWIPNASSCSSSFRFCLPSWGDGRKPTRDSRP